MMKFSIPFLVITLLIIFLAAACTRSTSDKEQKGDLAKLNIIEVEDALPAPESRRLIVAVPHDLEEEALISIFDRPIDYKLLDLFANLYGYTLEIKYFPSDTAALEALHKGQCHIAVGISSNAGTQADFRGGPVYANSSTVLIKRNSRQSRPAVKNLAALCDKTMQASPELAIQNFLSEQTKNLACTPAIEVKPTLALTPLLEDLSNSQTEAVAANSDLFNLTRSFFPQLQTIQGVNAPISYQWHWRAGEQELNANMDKFWSLESTKQEIEDYRLRVFGFLPKKIPNRQLRHLLSVLDKELPKYRKVILEEAKRNHIDPLLLVAVIYQESKFKSSARHRNTHGLMQLSPRTAAMFVSGKITDPTLNIQAGSRYLRYLWEDLEELQLPAWDRWALSLIAYNQGPGGLNKKITRAQARDCSVANWPEFKRLLPYLSKTSACGPVRSDAINYVDSVQYYYFFLRGLVVLGRPESKHLGPGFETTPEGWLES